MIRFLRTIAWALLALMSPLMAQAQDYAQPQQAAAPQPAYTQEQLDQLTAPIALYPDQLVGEILMAATYPLEVVEAYRWLQDPANAHLQGDALAQALTQQTWDPSVKSLVAFPQVLSTLNTNLQWTEQLGNAFLSQQAQVMDSVQRLRQMAQRSGNLASTPQQTVDDQNGAIVIQPTNPDVVYVPYYNPLYAYGTWPYDGYEPYYFQPFPGLVYAAGALIGFGFGVAILDQFWGWHSWDWRNHRLDIDNRRFEAINRGQPPRFSGGVWAHDPAHRRGVPYASPALRTRYQGAADQARRDFRGYAAQPNARIFNVATPHAATPIEREAPAFQRAPAAVPQARLESQMQVQTRAAPVFESFSTHGSDVRVESQRGASSRAVFQSAPMRAPEPARGGGGGGGGGHSGNMRNR